jgi:hypothetical protein
MKKRLDYILLRRRDELFDLKADPYSFNNLSENSNSKDQLKRLKQLAIAEMIRSEDPLLESLGDNTSYPAEWNKR